MKRNLLLLFCLFFLTVNSVSQSLENKTDLPLTSILKRQNDVLVVNELGIFRSELKSKKWKQITVPPKMPQNGRFADQPANSNLIFYNAPFSSCIKKSSNCNSLEFGLYLSSDNGKTWEIASSIKNFDYVFLHPNGKLFAVINAGNFQRQPQIFISEDLGKNWKEISKGFFGSFIQMLVDPDNPNLVMLIGNSIRGYHFQAKDENYEWKAMRSMDWFSRKSEKFKKLDLSRGFSTRTVAYILRATLKNYYQFDFGSQTEICPFFIIPKKENYKFKSNEPKFIQTALKFMVKRNPSDNAKELEIKITDSQNKTSEFWGINMILPDGNRKFSLAKAKQNSNYEVVRVSLNHPYHRKINLDDLGDFSQKGNYQVQLLYDNISLEPTEKDIWLGNFIGEVFTVTIY